jgi:DNA-binding MarR family transcriptional regulator
MTQLIQRLERQGLVTRLPDPDDGRAALIGITGGGQQLLDDRKRLRRARLAQLLATLSPEEENALWLSARVALPILSQMVEKADSASDCGAPHSPMTRDADQRKVAADG